MGPAGLPRCRSDPSCWQRGPEHRFPPGGPAALGWSSALAPGAPCGFVLTTGCPVPGICPPSAAGASTIRGQGRRFLQVHPRSQAWQACPPAKQSWRAKGLCLPTASAPGLPDPVRSGALLWEAVWQLIRSPRCHLCMQALEGGRFRVLLGGPPSRSLL